MICTELDIKLVDFSNAEETRDFASLIFSTANELGLFLSKSQHTQALAGIRLTAREWVGRVEDSIGSMSAGDALTVITVFDLIHRIGYNVPAKNVYIDKYKLGAFEAYIHGDMTVDQYTLYDAISYEVGRRNRMYLGRPLDWQTLCLDRWHKNFRTGTGASRQSDYDTVRQITALLSADLWAFEPDQNTFKRTLVANHMHLLNNGKTMDTSYKRAFEAFLSSAAKYISDEEYDACYSSLHHDEVSRSVKKRHQSEIGNHLGQAAR